MDDVPLDRWRAQTGASILGGASGPDAVTDAGDGWWLVLSGVPSADGNIGLVFADDPRVLRDVAGRVSSSGHPTLLMTAGAAPDEVLAPPWQDAGSMPFMAVELARTPTAYDPRVRRAGASDLGQVVPLLTEAYGMAPDIATSLVAPALATDRGIVFWLLHHEGDDVSTVMTARCDDVVTVWCMATRPHLQRNGFGRALLAHVCAAARDDGARTGLLGGSPAGEPLYRQTGWTTLEHWRIHVNAPSVQFTS